jgi:glyoxylate reductase
MRPRVFISQPIPGPALDMLRAVADLEMGDDASRIMPKAQYMEFLRRCDYLFHIMHDTVDREVLDANPNLRIIASQSITPALVDVAEATRRKIPVTTIPNVVYEATADLNWALLMAAARRIPEADRGVRAGVFPGSQSMHYMGQGVHGKTLGVIGLGQIGKGMARRGRGFAMRVLYWKRNRLRPEEEAALGVEYRPMAEVLREADFVSLNAAFTQETYHLMGAPQFALMKPTAIFLNTARGPMVEEQALVDALKAGRIAGAGLDVFEEEPKVHPDLLRMDRVVLTPHIGSAVRDVREEIAVIVANNILAAMRGERPPKVYNPEIYG